jgi:hypothetical protein
MKQPKIDLRDQSRQKRGEKRKNMKDYNNMLVIWGNNRIRR